MSLLRKIFKSKKKEIPLILSNIYHTANQQNVLISYVKDAFTVASEIPTYHTNLYSCQIIAEAFRDLGYNVDIISWTDHFHQDHTKYDVVFGLGTALEDILGKKVKGQKPVVISFGTGCDHSFSDKASLKRGLEFYEKKGRFLMNSLRFSTESWILQHTLADWIIIHGDKFCVDTYRKENISSILAPVFFFHEVERSNESWQQASKNFLWIGSRSAIHKGLDLCLESFKQMPDVHLHICGEFVFEPEFMEIYHDELHNLGNIHLHGYQDIKSEEFKQILANCAFVIFPSASEGNSPSVITAMANGGLIPIIPDSADVDIKNYGIKINELSVDGVKSAVSEATQLSIDQLKRASQDILKHTHEVHTFDKFKENIKAQFESIINGAQILQNDAEN